MRRTARGGNKRPALGLAAVALFVAPVFAGDDNQDPPGPPPASSQWTPITSHKLRFVVTDMPRRDALAAAVWAESVWEKIEGWSGLPIPRDHAYPIVISAALREDEPMGRAVYAQDIAADGRWRQEMTMINPSAMDEEDALEALCALLINRWAPPRSSTDGLKPGRVPDWLAIGVAQQLYPDLTARNVRMLQHAESIGAPLDPSALFAQSVFPPGRWPEKALAGLVTGFLADLAGPGALVRAVLARTAAGEPFDAGAAVLLLSVPDARTLNIKWDLWLARQDRRIIPGVMSGDPERVVRILELRPEDLGLIYPGPLPNGRLTAEMLIAARDHGWARDVSRAVIWSLSQELIGKTPELTARIRPFITFFEHLSPAPGNTTKKRRPRPPPDQEMRNQWDAAVRGFNDYAARYRAQMELLDTFAPKQIPDGLEALLDAWELREKEVE